MDCPYCHVHNATTRCMSCGAVFDAGAAAELARLAYLRNRLDRWHGAGLVSGETATCLIAATEPEVIDLQTRLGLRPAAPPAIAPATTPVTPSPLTPPSVAGSPPAVVGPLPQPRAARPAFSWAQVGVYLLAERTLNTLLGLGALLILASAFVISTLNPTRLGPAAHLSVMIATTAAFYAAGFAVRQELRLVRTGATLLAIGAGLIPLDIWTLGHGSALHWDAGTIWLVASTLCLPIYLAAHVLLRDRTFAVLTALAGGSELLAVAHSLGVPVEWGLCAVVGLAIGYLLLARRLPDRWAPLAWALFWAAQVATPLVMAALLVARFVPAAWAAAAPAQHGAPSDYAVGGAWWLGAAFYILSARAGGERRYRFLAAWTLPVAYLLTLTKAPWDASWYNLCLALLAAGYLAFGFLLQRDGIGRHVGRLLAHPIYGTAVFLSLIAALWPAASQESALATLLTLAAAYAAAAFLLRQRACAYAAVYLLPLAYVPALGELGLDRAAQVLAWAGLACALVVAAEYAAGHTGEVRRPLLETVIGLGAWRSRFAAPLFSAGYGVGLVALGLCVVMYDRATPVFGIPVPALPVILALLAIVALSAASAATRRSSAFLWLAAPLFLLPCASLGALLAERSHLLAFPSLRADVAPLAALGIGYLAIAYLTDRAREHYAKPLYVMGYGLVAIPMLALSPGRATAVGVGALNLLVYAWSAWLVGRARHPSYLWLVAALFPQPSSPAYRVARTLFVYLTAWGFPLWLILAAGLWWPALAPSAYGLVLAGLAPLYVALGIGARRIGDGSDWPWYIGGYTLSVLGPVLTGPDLTPWIVALAVSIALYAGSAILFRRSAWLYPVAFLGPVLLWSVLLWATLPYRFFGLGLWPGVAAWLAIAEALRRRLDGNAPRPAVRPDYGRWSTPFNAALVTEMIVVGLSLAAAGVTALPSYPDAGVALWTALAYVVLYGAVAVAWQGRLAAWASLLFTAVAIEDGLGLAHVAWLDQPPRWALAALVAALLSFALPLVRLSRVRLSRVHRDVAGLYTGLYRRPLYRGSIGLGVLALAVALANELVLLDHAALQSLTATVAVSGLVLIAHGWNRHQALLGYAGVGLLEAAYMLQLTLFDVGQPQAFVLPAGLYLLVIAYLEWRRGTGAGLKMVLEVAALLLLLGTSLLQSLGYLDAGAGGYVCEVFLLCESVALVGLGAVLHWKRTFFAGSAALVADVGIMLSDPLRAMNTWYLMAIVGCAMIALVVFIEQRRQRIPLWVDEWRLRLEAWD